MCATHWETGTGIYRECVYQATREIGFLSNVVYIASSRIIYESIENYVYINKYYSKQESISY